MSDQVPEQSNSVFHGGFQLAICQLTTNQKYFDVSASVDNLVLVENAPNGNEPVGFARFQASGGGAHNVSGMVPNNGKFPDHNVFLFCRVDGPDSVTFLNESALSAPQNRFIIGGDTTLAAGVFVIFVYLPDFQRWGLLFHS